MVYRVYVLYQIFNSPYVKSIKSLIFVFFQGVRIGLQGVRIGLRTLKSRNKNFQSSVLVYRVYVVYQIFNSPYAKSIKSLISVFFQGVRTCLQGVRIGLRTLKSRNKNVQSSVLVYRVYVVHRGIWWGHQLPTYPRSSFTKGA